MAKGHWLVNNIQKEGLRHPIQGHTNLGLEVDSNINYLYIHIY